MEGGENGTSGWAASASTSAGAGQDLSDWLTIGALSWMFLLGAPVNLALFFSLTERLGSLRTKERLKLQLLGADLLVLFVYAVSKVCWHISFSWRGGPVLCKLVKFAHELAFQFSSAILASIGLDRCANVLQPFRTPEQIQRRVSVLIGGSWAYAVLLSSPQLYRWVLVEVGRPGAASFPQCTSRLRLLSDGPADRPQRLLLAALHVLHLLTVFWLPLLLMLVSYAIISSYIWNLYRITRPGYRLASVDSVTGQAPPSATWRSWLPTKRFARAGSGRAGSADAHLLASPQGKALCGEEGPGLGTPGRPAGRANGAVSFHQTRETVLIGEAGEVVRSSESVEPVLPRPSVPAQPKPQTRTLPIRTMKITLLLISSYVVCWTPYHVTALVPELFGEGPVGRGLELGFSLLIVLPSVLNPWIYGLYTRPSQSSH